MIFALGGGFLLLLVMGIVIDAGTFSLGAIVGTSTALLTVEGFLLGLSSLIVNKRSQLYFATVTVGIVAVIIALMTIAVAQMTLALQTKYPDQMITEKTPVMLGASATNYFVWSVVLFTFMLEIYWLGLIQRKPRKRDFLTPGPY